MPDGSLIFDTQIDSTGIERFAGIAKAGLGAVITASAAAGTALTAAGTYAVGLASDLTEVQNVVDVTFGDNASTINDWAKSAAESFGMSELQAKQFNGTMGAMLKSMGLTNDEVLNMSTSMSGLAGDFASFYNLDPQEAFDKIRSGISGETEPLKQLGINMSVANLEAYAMSEGIKTAYSEMSQAEQATLRYNYLMQVSADAQGDFAKTSDSLANQLRILKLNASDTAAAIGTDLMPMVQDGVSMLNGMITDLGTAYETGGIDGLTSAVGDVLGDLIAEITDAAPDVIDAAMSVIEGLVSSLVENADTIAQGVTAIATSLVEGLTGMLPELLQAVLSIAKGLAESLGEAAPELIPQVINDVLDVIMTALSNVSGMIDAGLALIQGLADGLINSIPVLVERAPEIITAILEGIITAATKLLLGGAEMMQNLNQGMMDSLGNGEQFENIGWTIQKAIWRGIEQGFENFGADLYDYIYKGSPMEDKADERQSKADAGLAEAEAILAQKQQEAVATAKETSAKMTEIAAESLNKGADIVGKMSSTFSSAAVAGKAKAKTEEEIKKNTESLKTAWEQAQHDYATGVIATDQELYNKRLEILQKYGDASNKDHWSYYEIIKKMENDFADDNAKIAENNAKKAEEAAEKEKKAQEKLTEDIQKEREKQLDIIKDSLKKQLDAAKETINKTISEYKSQFDTINGYADDYKSKLLDVGDVFTVKTEKDKNGKDKTTYKVEDINAQIKAMEDYNADVKRLKEQGASQALLSEVTGMGFEQGSNFADYLDGMSNEEFAKINELYNKRQQAADELSKGLYADEVESLKTDFISEVEKAYGELPESIRKVGEDSLKAFMSSFTLTNETSFDGATAYFDTFVQSAQTSIEGINIDEAVKTSLSDADMATLGQTAGQQFTEAFNKEMEGLTVSLISGVQAEKASTAAAMTGASTSKSAAATATSKAETIVVENHVNTELVMDGEKMGQKSYTYSKKIDRQKGK